ncbi:hypothetical protein ACIQOV_25030 [Kitasatospora sp. NPDC091257]|uniref:hypothetical protein n=1 Tax=Kitasatospora sp. NPDC091257 TaxID=3364084 RepID=UPI0037F61CB4
MNAMNNEHVILSLGPASDHRSVVMRGPADMAELLPYFLGFYPDDSLSSLCVHSEAQVATDGRTPKGRGLALVKDLVMSESQPALLPA